MGGNDERLNILFPQGPFMDANDAPSLLDYGRGNQYISFKGAELGDEEGTLAGGKMHKKLLFSYSSMF